jgi:hypothetical protein
VLAVGGLKEKILAAFELESRYGTEPLPVCKRILSNILGLHNTHRPIVEEFSKTLQARQGVHWIHQ